MLATMSLVGVIILAVLVAVYLHLRRQDLLGAMMEKRRASSTIVTRADYVEGRDQIPVALSLNGQSLYYENPDLDASFDLDRLDEIEYTDDLATGRDVHGHRVLRLRSHGATFEFLLEKKDANKWESALPPHTYGSGQTAARAV